MKHIVAGLSALLLLVGTADAQIIRDTGPMEKLRTHSHAQCLRSAPHLAAVQAAVDAANAECAAAKAAMQIEFDAALEDLRVQMDSQEAAFDVERLRLIQERDTALQELERAVAEVVSVRAALEASQQDTLRVQAQLEATETQLADALAALAEWQRPQSAAPPVIFASKVSVSTSTEIIAPAGAVRAWWGVGTQSDLGAGPYIGRWSVHPVTDGKVKVEFAGAKPGPVNGLIMWDFADKASLWQEVVADVAQPLSTWTEPTVDTGSVSQQVELGDYRRADATVRIVGIRAWRAFSTRGAPTVGRIWTKEGVKLAEVPLECPETGWCVGYFPAHTIIIDKDVEFVVSYDAPSGWAGDAGFFGTATAPTLPPSTNGMSVLSGVYAYPSTTGYPFPTVKHTTNYWADVLTVPIE